MNRAATLAVLLSLAGAGSALADGGRLRASRQEGDWRISVFTSPEPLRAGPADLSVLVQDAVSGQTLWDVDVETRLWPREEPPRAICATATRAAATNKLFRSAMVEIDRAGEWEVEVACSQPGEPTRKLRFAVDVEPPLPLASAIWPWFSWPAAVVVLFLAHRWLAARKHAAPSRDAAMC